MGIIRNIKCRFFLILCYNKGNLITSNNQIAYRKERKIVYKALDVARYVIDYEATQDRTVSNLRLQKLLYFIQCAFLAAFNEPCFEDDLEAWDYGPVVPEVYRKYKIFGSTLIPASSHHNKSIFSNKDMSLINNMLNACASRSTSTLVQISHNQDPWKNSYVAGMNNVITKNSIARYVKRVQS